MAIDREHRDRPIHIGMVASGLMAQQLWSWPRPFAVGDALLVSFCIAGELAQSA
jgi:hypothetical protein